ncbi:flagellar hook-length control protein FliK [Pseudomonas sp. Y5-11]|jgi:flagellar hook-length control protein FliK|uniref:flagellar hook-length control protein FliK n=1 Tax=Pseudomonas sp. Y5-11 TaxID=2749808 RepID=UPI001EFA49F4|nr:flagellar hook-length control protein FliK [Pseudomonas sp. Y5-11]ULN82845.1 flagellar hook-length control protein FliK [Pseudomonas sp. Y5-11]
MPATPNVLLQSAAQAKAQAAAAKAPVMAADTGDKASSFAQVFADQGPKKSLASADSSLKPSRDKVADNSDKKDFGKDKSAATQPAVADSGNALPADKTASTASDEQAAADKAATDAAADSAQTPVADTTPVDPALVQTLQPLVTAPAVPAPVAATPEPVKAETPVVAATVAPAVVKDPAASTDSAFDPAADPLDSLPAVRMAMEQGGHISASSQAQPKATPAQTQADGELTSAQNFAAGMASMLDVQADKDSTSQNGEKAFSGLIDDGLKDLKAATSDTRVDDFANRLAALTQAATPKTANAVPVNQPIAMHQSGWTEEIVNRVMYLSSANLKAADIQLQPAELGRLDIRVNMVPDQQTQVTFMSAHPSVREALDGQMHRLRDMFTQQGMGQVDVNVSDQSRGWQGQQGQEQAQHGQSGRTSAAGGRLDSAEEELAPVSVAEAAAQTTSVIGSSAVDYYA